MNKYLADKIRNIGIFAHGGAGKTSLAEAVLYDAGIGNRLGKVDDGTSTSDYDPAEIKRKISINSTILPLEWNEHKINFIDTPGYADFVADVKAAIRVVDSALILLCAVAGVEVNTEMFWEYATEANLPVIFLINKMDRENADFNKVYEAIRNKLTKNAVAVWIPFGSQSAFRGIIDLLTMKAIIFEENGRKFQEEEIPNDYKAEAGKHHEKLLEALAETDEVLTEKFLGGEEISEEEMRKALRSAVQSRKIVPVLCGSALQNKGIQPLLNLIVDCFPSPMDRPPVVGLDLKNQEEIKIKLDAQASLCALVFKTMADPYIGKLSYFRVFAGTLKADSYLFNSNRDCEEKGGQVFFMRGKNQEVADEVIAGDIGVIAKLQKTVTGDTLCAGEQPIKLPPVEFPTAMMSAAIQPRSKGDEDKLGTVLARLIEEDPSFSVERDTVVGQTVVSGMGGTHLEIMTERLKNKFGVEVDLVPRKVSYKETIRSKAEAEYKHKKQTGGHGQYGHVFLRVEPLPRGSNFEFANEVFGGVVPKNYVPAVEKGVRDAISEGILAGYPVVDVKVILFDGSYHSVDSSEISFKIAAAMAFRKGMQQANPVLLEPIWEIEVTVPEEYMGDVISDLNARRGKILGMEQSGKNQNIKSLVPMAEILRYAIDLKSITQGRGSFRAKFSGYEEIPAHIADKIIAESKKAKPG